MNGWLGGFIATVRGKLEFTAAVAVVLAFVVLSVMTCEAREAAHTAELAVLNQKASVDTSHRITDEAASSVLAAAGLEGVQKLVMQMAQKNSQLEKDLHINREATYQVGAQLRAAMGGGNGLTTTPAPDATDTTTRIAKFDSLDLSPYRLWAVATIPAHSPPSLTARITSRPIALQLQLECSTATANGTRAASAILTGDSTLALHLGTVSQSPDVCSSGTGASTNRRRWGVGATAGYGAVWDRGAVRTGPGMLFGVSYTF